MTREEPSNNSFALSQIYLLGTIVDDFVFVGESMSMGLRILASCLKRILVIRLFRLCSCVIPIADVVGPVVGNYLDDIWILADSADKNMFQLLVAKW